MCCDPPASLLIDTQEAKKDEVKGGEEAKLRRAEELRKRRERMQKRKENLEADTRRPGKSHSLQSLMWPLVKMLIYHNTQNRNNNGLLLP